MLTLYRPGDGPWHRLTAGRKSAVLGLIVLGVSVVPASWWGAALTAGVCLACYAVRGAGMGALVRQGIAIRWILAVTLAGQLLFLGAETGVANTVRICAAVVISGLLALTTPVSELLEALERGLSPLARLRVDPQRAALTIAVTLSTLPVLVRLEREVREAQNARGGGRSLRLFAIPFLVVSLKHADALGDALTARGVR
ncbi:MAG: cobalt ABC transporter permease [Actinobacteria bacterium HGW-Actinobacteria-4]|nr:MAG: cobalt ABC transporter permease [Actinobacteria bacterium HGW-Actinobacteria-4]